MPLVATALARLGNTVNIVQMSDFLTPSIIERHIELTHPDCPALGAIAQLHQAQHGCILIVDAAKVEPPQPPLLGWLTPQDVLSWVLSGANLSTLTVGDIMTQPPQVLLLSTLLDRRRSAIADLLLSNTCPCLPVVDDQGYPVGLITTHSLLQPGTEKPSLPVVPLTSDDPNLTQLFAIAFDHVNDAIEITDAHKVIQYVNPASERITGYSQGEVIGKTPAQVFRSDYHDLAFYQALEDTLDRQQCWQGELVSRNKDGGYCRQATTITPVVNAKGVITNFIAIKRDVTQDHNTQQDLQASEEKFRQLADNIYEVFYIAEFPSGRLLYVSSSFEQIWGRSPDYLNRNTYLWLKSVHPQDRPGVIANFHRLQTGIRVELEYRIVRLDGSVRWIRSRISPIRDATGQIYRTVGTAEDITIRKQTALDLQALNQDLETRVIERTAALQASEAELHSLFAAMTDLVLVLGADGRYLKIPQHHPQNLYKPADQLLGKTVHEVFSPDNAQLFMDYIQRALATQQTITGEYSLMLGDQLTWFNVKVSPLSDTAVIFVARDVTARKLAEQTLVEQAAKLSHFAFSLKHLHRLQLATFDSTDALFNDYIQTGCKILNFSGGAISSIQANTYTVLAVQSDFEQFVPGLTIALDQVYCQQVVELETTIAYSEAGRMAEIQGHPMYQNFKLESYIATPIFVDGLLYGTLGFFSTKPRPEGFAHHEHEIIEMMAQNVGKYLSALQAETVLKESEERFRQLAENIQDVFWMRSLDQRQLLYVSPAYEFVWGRLCQELYKWPRDWFDAIHPDDRDRILTMMMEQSLGVYDEEYRILHTDGHVRWIRDRAFPIYNEAGELYRIAGIAEDISDRKGVELELRQAKEAAEAANRAKSQFLASMSHELRTPLNAILGFTELMGQDRSLDPDYQHYLSIVNQSGQHLLALINNVLEISRIEAGNIEIEVDTFDLYSLLTSLNNLLRLKASAKGIEFNIRHSHDVPQYIATDERKLKQILLNLLDNAIKFTAQGEVALEVSIRYPAYLPNPAHWDQNLPERCCELVALVNDTGTGISADELQRLFQPFEQTQSGRQSSQGSGLGLAISQRFARTMGGDITVNSTLGQGTQFQLRLPIQIPTLPTQGTKALGDGVLELSSDQTTYRILVVDDDPLGRLLIRKIFSPLGFQIEEAVNGQHAIQQWQLYKPHLILMDMKMPIMDGYEATRRIREAQDEAPETPIPVVIALSASAFAEDQDRCLEIGCDDFVSKPLRKNLILEKVAHYLGMRYAYAQPVAPTGSWNEAPEHQRIKDLLMQMPETWTRELYNAAITGSDDLIVLLASQAGNPLGKMLHEWAQNYQFERILNLFIDQV